MFVHQKLAVAVFPQTFFTQTPKWFSVQKAQPFGRLSIDQLVTVLPNGQQGYPEKFYAEVCGFLCLLFLPPQAHW